MALGEVGNADVAQERCGSYLVELKAVSYGRETQFTDLKRPYGAWLSQSCGGPGRIGRSSRTRRIGLTCIPDSNLSVKPANRNNAGTSLAASLQKVRSRSRGNEKGAPWCC